MVEDKNWICPVCGCTLKQPSKHRICPRCGSSLEDKESESVRGPYRRCPVCQAENPMNAQLCIRCGSLIDPPLKPLQPMVSPIGSPRPAQPAATVSAPPPEAFTYQGILPQDTIEGIPASEIAAYIGTKEKSDYYLPRFAKMAQSEKKAGWNWAAFLIFPYWALYRKMIKPAVVYLVSAFVLTAAYVIVGGSCMLHVMNEVQTGGDLTTQMMLKEMGRVSLVAGVCMLILLIAHITLGVFANAIYWRQMKLRLRPPEESIPQSLMERVARAGLLGGVKTSYPLIAWGINVGATYILSFLLAIVAMFQVVGRW